jgi:hypothetical protein
MKIIHGHDFYDHAHAGVDPEIIFVRDGQPKKPITSEDFPFRPHGRAEIHLGHRRYAKSPFFLGYVIAAGTVYPVMVLENGKRFEEARGYGFGSCPSPAQGMADHGEFSFRRSNDGHYRFIYDADEALAIAKDFYDAAEEEALFKDSIQKRRAEAHDHFHIRNPDWDRWVIEHGVVTGAILGSWNNFDRSRIHGRQFDPVQAFERHLNIEVNLDILGPAEFFKVQDPFTTFQDIAQFVGGVLASQGNDMAEIGNLDKVRKAGFDTKTSFRKAPTKRAD